MDPTDDTKSNDKHSSHSSEGKPRRRPSLFPIRNSAKRKNSFSESPHVFDPHHPDQGDSKNNQLEFDTDISGERETKSDSQFQFKTPNSQLSNQSPRTPRTTPRQLAADTPFIPFVHQSLTRTVWQSDQIIPEERDEMQRKQSQTQYHYNKQQQQNEIESPIYPPKDMNSQNIQMSTTNQQNLYPDLLLQPSTYNNQNQQIIKIQQNTNNNNNVNNSNTQLSNFQLQTSQQVFISIPPSQKQNDKQKSIISQNNYHSNSQFNTISNNNIKQQQLSSVNNTPLYEIGNQVRHQVFVSKAPIYYKQEIERQKQFRICNSFHQHIIPKKVYRKLGFSFIDCISVKPKIIQSNYQQTQQKQLTICQPQFHHIIKPLIKQCEFCQTQQIQQQNKLSICNKTHQAVSMKKNTKQAQTSFLQRFNSISKAYQQKIGIQKQYIESSQQTYIQKFNYAQQTQNPQKKLRINSQVDFSVSYDYQQHLDTSVVRFQNYLKNLHQTRESQLLQLKNKRLINQQTNTDNDNVKQNTSTKKSNIKTKSVKNFACQYDPKDVGIKPSIKRVSISDKNVVFDVPDDNSTQTYQLSNEKQNQSKKKKKENQRKSKKNVQKQVKIQQRSVESQQSQIYVPSQQVEADAEEQAHAQKMETRKSKRKASKTPKKKKN